MPRYGGYGYMPQMGGGQDANPFFDPYSATPDYGAGIAAMIKNLWQMDALKKQQEAASSQQAFENKMSSADYDYKRAQTEALKARPTKPAVEPSAEAKTIEYLIGIGIPPELAAQMVTNYKPETPLEMLPGMDKIFSGMTPDTWGKLPGKAREKFTDEFLTRTRPDKTGSSTDAATKSDTALLTKVVDKYDAAVRAVEEDASRAESEMVTARSADKPARASFHGARQKDLSSQRDSLVKVKEYLATIGEQLGSGRPLTGKQRARLSGLLASVDAAKVNPSLLTDIGGSSATPAATAGPERRIVPSGPNAGTWERIPGTESWRKIS